MSDEDDCDFAGAEDAKAKLRVAIAYLLKDTNGHARAAAALEIVEILRQVTNGTPPPQSDPFDNELPGG